MPNLSRRSLVWFVSDIIKYGMGFIALLIIVRYMGPEPIGIIAVATGFITLFAFIPSMGLETAHQKIYSDKNYNKSEALGTYVFLKVILISVYVMVIISVLSYYAYIDMPLFTGRQLHVIIIILVSRILFHLTKVQRNSFIADERPATNQLSEIINKFVLDALQIGVAVLGYTVLALSFSYVVANVVGFLVCVMMFRKYIFSKPTRRMVRLYLKFGLPLTAVIILSGINESIDRLLIYKFHGINEVAFYEVSIKLLALFTFLRVAVSGILFPVMSRYHSSNQLNEILVISHKSERYLTIIGTPMLMFLLFYTTELTEFFLGDEFIPAVRIIQIITIVTYVRMISVAYLIQLAACGYIMLVGKIGVITTLVNILLCLLLIPDEIYNTQLLNQGAYGAAIALMISTLMGILSHRYYTYKYNNVKSNYRILLIIFVGALTALMVKYLFKEYSTLDMIILPLVFIVMSVIFIVVLRVIKEVNSNDIALLRNLLNVRNMKKYLVEDLSKNN